MDQKNAFNLAQARPQVEKLLEQAGFDLIDDPGESNLIQGQKDSGANVLIDGGGQLRYSITRTSSPPLSQQKKTTNGHEFNLVREVNETLTVNLQLDNAAELQEYLAEFSRL